MQSSLNGKRICLFTNLVALRTHPMVRVLILTSSIHRYHPLAAQEYFNLLSITYAFQPRLRDRLTQRRRTWLWKPWVFGEDDFHILYRLLMPCIITSMRSNAPYGTSSTLHTTLSYRSLKLVNPWFRLYALVPDIIGAEFLDWWAVTHSLNDGCL